MEKIKQNRAASFAVIAVVYLLATALGVVVYATLTGALWWRLLLSDVAATLLTFVFSVIFKNASVYDPYWSVQPPVILAALAVAHGLNIFGALLLAVVTLWGVRLTANWAYTFGNLLHQDWRYTMLAEKTGRFYPLINLVGIHLVPTLVVWGCVLPAAVAIEKGLLLKPLCAMALLLSLAATVLQAVSDIFMQRHRQSGVGGFIRKGPWRHARHPNYLGEILMWWGIGLAVVAAAPDMWYLLSGALANTLLFFFVSIPMAEGKQSKKAGFAAYRAETRVLLPLPRFFK